MKARLILAITEQVSEYDYERHYKTVDVEVTIPDVDKKLYKQHDIIGGQWLPDENEEVLK